MSKTSNIEVRVQLQIATSTDDGCHVATSNTDEAWRRFWREVASHPVQLLLNDFYSLVFTARSLFSIFIPINRSKTQST